MHLLAIKRLNESNLDVIKLGNTQRSKQYAGEIVLKLSNSVLHFDDLRKYFKDNGQGLGF